MIPLRPNGSANKSNGEDRTSRVQELVDRAQRSRERAMLEASVAESQADEGPTRSAVAPQIVDPPLDIVPEDATLKGPRRAATLPPALMDIKEKVHAQLLERMDAAAAAKLSPADLTPEVNSMVREILNEISMPLNGGELAMLVQAIVDDMLALGPLEPLLEDDDINDIMVNGAGRVFVERRGKVELSPVTFRDNAHVLHIATRIVSRIGRRIDETSPYVDARLEDGSRVNIVIPPLAIDGPAISIRKFAKSRITLKKMAEQGNLSDQIRTVLEVASACRLNIFISGGTGSGKTTLLNALSQLIDNGERIVTIEDAAELQLDQINLVRLETRSANLEGKGEVTMRDLVKNALRMRPDRIILGETRGAEAVDVLQAMNTGHDGSMSTVHANRPREALTRLENMVAMAGFNLPAKAVRTQIAQAVDLIVQIQRMRDGKRRITSVTEVMGMEGEVIVTQDLFTFKYLDETEEGDIIGEFNSLGVRPHLSEKARQFGLQEKLLSAI